MTSSAPSTEETWLRKRPGLGRVARVRCMNLGLGVASDVAFSCSSHIHRNHSTTLIAVQPSFSTIRCKPLNIFIKVCYSLPCTPNPIPANLFRLLRVISVDSASPRSPGFSPAVSQTFNFQLSPLNPSAPLSSFLSSRLPTPTLSVFCYHFVP